VGVIMVETIFDTCPYANNALTKKVWAYVASSDGGFVCC